MALSDDWRKPREMHGMYRSKVYKVWASMVARCHIRSASGFENYGGRGIRVCDRWRMFENFLSDMGEPPRGYSLDRIDNERGYEPGNCRWVEPAEQRRNQRDLIYVTIGGERACLAVWAARNGISYSTALGRINRGWDAARAVTAPVRAHKPYERQSHGAA